MAAYALTVFVGAFLLFQVQPLIGKYLLPWFGGGPSVWTTCMFFFQVVLLGGYAYAHILTRCFRPRAQAALHLVLIVVALVCLPIVPSQAWKPRTNEHPSLAIFALLACNLGVPFFVLSSTGPLLQKWSIRSNSRTSPYRLYALSNLGSLLALVTYPLFFETHFSRQAQATIWAWGLLFYGFGCGFCAVKASACSRGLDLAGETPALPVHQRGPTTIFQRVLWVLWPACASVLLLAITNKLCLDVAVFPFLWVVPLGFYLISFIICFDSPRWYARTPFTVALGLAMAAVCWTLFKGANWPFWTQVCAYAGVLFMCCLVCHGELFRIRPEPQRLTEFYLLVAAGGALGGLFVSLAAPAIFTNYYELHWGLALCGLLVVCVRTIDQIGLLPAAKLAPLSPSSSASCRSAAWSHHDWKRLGLAFLWVGFLGLATTLWLQARRSGSAIVHKSRNFYGVLTVFEHRKDEPNGRHFVLQHGRITHGFQFANPQLQAWPTTYYGPDSGVGLALKALPEPNRRIGVIGLGTGTIAAYARPGDYLHFYEINPAVSNIATSRFTYLTRCRADWEVTPGDARLALEREPAQRFDLLALDAFTSDSIPVHLLTKEAFDIYLKHLKPDGVIAVHTSNHFLDLDPVVARVATQFRLKISVIDHDAKPEQWWIYSSTWILLSRDEQILSQPAICSAQKANQQGKTGLRLWTDDFSSLFQILR